MVGKAWVSLAWLIFLTYLPVRGDVPYNMHKDACTGFGVGYSTSPRTDCYTQHVEKPPQNFPDKSVGSIMSVLGASIGFSRDTHCIIQALSRARSPIQHVSYWIELKDVRNSQTTFRSLMPTISYNPTE